MWGVQHIPKRLQVKFSSSFLTSNTEFANTNSHVVVYEAWVSDENGWRYENADGSFTVADLVMLEKYLLGAGTLTDWQAGDLCNDGVIDVFDIIEMREEITK